MVLSEEYEIKPANSSCANQMNKSIIIPTPGTATNANQIQVNAVEDQHNENSKYDNIDGINIKPLYGGNKNNKNNKYYKINFNNKIKKYKAKNEREAINIFLTKNILTKDYLLEISECTKNKNNIKDTLYLIKIRK